jgi:mannose-6-phosphate isomerase-like protein (cupin superfamily)
MSSGRHYSFESARFVEVVAHDGNHPIEFHRAEEGGLACNFVDLSVVPVGADIGIHRHENDNEEIYVIISGRGWMHLDDRQFEVGPGHVIVNRPGGAHGLKNIGDVPLKMVVVEIPVRSDRQEEPCSPSSGPQTAISR